MTAPGAGGRMRGHGGDLCLRTTWKHRADPSFREEGAGPASCTQPALLKALIV